MRTGISESVRAVLATALETSLAGIGGASILRLFQNDLVPGPAVELSDFVQCDFAGYVQATTSPGWIGWRDGASGSWQLAYSALAEFAFTGPGVSQLAYGWYLVDHTGNGLLAWGRFDAPYHFAATNDGIGVPIISTLLLGTCQTF